MNALVVEDDILIARLLGEILTRHGLAVADVSDGALAVPSVRARFPDVVLLDVGLPGVNGLEVLRQLKADPDLADIPVIVVTAWYDAALDARARSLGACEVIGKPFAASAITRAVDAAIASRPDQADNH